MTKEEYNKRLDLIHKEKNNKIKKLQAEYAFSNNPYKIGDIIKDHYQCIKIEKIKYSCYMTGYSECVYIGPRLEKDLSPFKSGESGTIHQSNIK